MQRLSLAQQIVQLEDVAPLDFDPEDIQSAGVDPEDEDTNKNLAARAHYIDVGLSTLRSLDSLSDLKYDGVKTSRKALLGDSDDSNPDSDSNRDGMPSDGDQEGEEEYALSERESNHEMDTRSTSNISMSRSSIPEPNDDLSTTLRKTREEDRQKGKAISRQIALWDSLLDARIRLQKSVAAGNRLPPLSLDVDDEKVQSSLTKMLEEAQLLSDEILDFQERLLSANESIEPLARKRRKVAHDDYLATRYAEGLQEASHAVSQLESTYHPHLVQTLDKWSSKIQAVAPSVLLPSNRNAFTQPKQLIKSATQLIDETLADHPKVLARTRVYRGRGSRLGTQARVEDGVQQTEDPQVFDDTDFYHQLLRDIIDSRGNSASDDWMTLQKEKKAKKKVDTKASKGRKLRYEVHEKIQNFMVPVPMQGSWHEEQIDELFASLLGKGYESAMQEVGEVATDDVTMTSQEEVTAALQGGFRIFG